MSFSSLLTPIPKCYHLYVGEDSPGHIFLLLRWRNENMKVIMSGNEAIARGAYEGGARFASAYPGTPSTEILENMPQYG